MPSPIVVSIHDPVHGSIELTQDELALLDSRPLQRLRSIKQLGFSEYAFPGACHSRFSHSLGAMQMATRMFDKLLGKADAEVPLAWQQAMRQAVRLATLCHDLGHPPLSHVSERIMPPRKRLGLPAQVEAAMDDDDAQATHEDYTLKLCYDSPLGDALTERFAGDGVDADCLASLVLGRHVGPARQRFFASGVDWLPVLHAIISGELDADRMDYLRRDAHHSGVSYGQFDHEWLCANLVPVEVDGAMTLALKHKAVWAFEHFLLARYHMFLTVYYHHTSVCFEHLLGRYFASGEYVLPSDSDAYLDRDDIHLWGTMRQSENAWAQAVCARKPWALALETHAYDGDPEQTSLPRALEGVDIEHFVAESRGSLSRYFGRGPMPLGVLEPERGRVRSIEHYTPLYDRFRQSVQLTRIYCRPSERARLRQALTGRPDASSQAIGVRSR